jgi:hypothetical protein
MRRMAVTPSLDGQKQSERINDQWNPSLGGTLGMIVRQTTADRGESVYRGDGIVRAIARHQFGGCIAHSSLDGS